MKKHLSTVLFSCLLLCFSACAPTVIIETKTPVKSSLKSPQMVVVYDGEQSLDWVVSFEERIARALPGHLNAISMRKVLVDPHATVDEHVKSLQSKGMTTVLLVKLVKKPQDMILSNDEDGGSIRGRQHLDESTTKTMEDAVVLRAELYDLATRRLMYNCLSKTSQKHPTLATGSSFGKAIGKNLKKEGLL
ncbi:hypothetical protein [Persicobacter psychrovividus]|uniref:Uncharacterized protein n=1 Tax=Persicobacter psychrovividus TaxID=387638 RepID=A0ABM7VI42_9BACT|nr:hypothetical protein PEPS_26830 [Persicobacter psychrovividus]